MGDNAISRVEAWLAHLKRLGYGDDLLVNETVNVSAGDIRELLSLAKQAQEALDRLSPNLET